MKKKLISVALCFATICMGLTACVKQPQTTTIFASEEPTYTLVEVDKNEKEETPQGREETPTQQSAGAVWGSIATNDEYNDCYYVTSVSDDFLLAKECTFGKYVDDINKVSQAFNDPSTLKQVFSLFYCDEDAWYTVPDDSKIWTLARLAILSYCLDSIHNDELQGKGELARMYTLSTNTHSLCFDYYVDGDTTDESKWAGTIAYIYDTDELMYRDPVSGNDYSVKVPMGGGYAFDSAYIKGFADIVNISLRGGELDYVESMHSISTVGESAMMEHLMPEDSHGKCDWLLFDKTTHTGSKSTSLFYQYTLHDWYESIFGQSSTGNTTPTVDGGQGGDDTPTPYYTEKGVSLVDYDYKMLGDRANEAQTAIENYFGSTIVKIEDKGYTDNEGATITMANGKTCSYFGSPNTGIASISDGETYDVIWKNY